MLLGRFIFLRFCTVHPPTLHSPSGKLYSTCRSSFLLVGSDVNRYTITYLTSPVSLSLCCSLLIACTSHFSCSRTCLLSYTGFSFSLIFKTLFFSRIFFALLQLYLCVLSLFHFPLIFSSLSSSYSLRLTTTPTNTSSSLDSFLLTLPHFLLPTIPLSSHTVSTFSSHSSSH